MLDEISNSLLPTPAIHHLFEQQVKRSPHSIAVSFEQERLSYLELNRKSNQLAHFLRSLGVQKEHFVGLFIDRSCEMLVGLLGILKAGAAYVPLDPIYPAQRLSNMIQDARLKWVVTQSHLNSHLPVDQLTSIQLDTHERSIAAMPDTDLPIPFNSDDTAYVMYTSGSTGQPKGVQLLHRGVVNFLLSMQRAPGIKPDDKMLAITTLCFDISVLECLLPLTVGAEVIVLDGRGVTDGIRMLQTLNETKATMLQATPATWRMLLEAGWQKTPRLKILCGGEALSSELARELLERADEVWNMYGPTETTVWSTRKRITTAREPISAGTPISNTWIYILSEEMKPVMGNETGELYIGGEGVARGYLNQPQITAERFIKDPFKSEGRIYKTGDLARWLPDGEVQILGRSDHQIKIRGYRIEIGEIESTLSHHPAVKEAVVLADDHSTHEKRLVCYMRTQSKTPTELELRNFLSRRLPNYMVPSSFRFVEKFPLTLSGKVDRKALSGIHWKSAPKERLNARNETERKLIHTAKKILKVDDFGVNDNFFEQGGSSLTAITFVTEIEKEFGKRIPFAQFMRAPTIEALSRYLNHFSCDVQSSSLVGMRMSGKHPPFYCVAGASDTVLRFQHLVEYMGADHPFYGLQSKDLDGNQEPDATVQSVAFEYLKDIRRQQPHGPYYLGGYCFGAVIAFEMARQLLLEREVVETLAMIEPSTESLSSLLPSAGLPSLDRYLYHGEKLWQLSFNQKIDYLQKRSRNILKRLYSKARNDDRARVGAQTTRMAQNYIPTPISCRITIFLGKDTFISRRSEDDPRLGWAWLTSGGTEVYRISGDHINIIEEPNVRLLSDYLKISIHQASSRPSKASSTMGKESAQVVH
jgi:amino acid adenylation domain-containing protein